MPRTLFDKIWDQHAITTNAAGHTLLYIDWLLFAESTFADFEVLRNDGYSVRRPAQLFGIADHYTPSHGTTLADACASAFAASKASPSASAEKIQRWFAEWMQLGWLCR